MKLMGRERRSPDADTPDPSGVWAQYLDDCWEPEEADALLRKFAAPTGAAKTGIPLCLRVVGREVN